MEQLETMQAQRVIVTDINMKFGSMIIFLVKLAIAAIPAIIILYAIALIPILFFAGMLSPLLEGL